MAKIDELEGKLIRQRRKKVQIRTEIRERIEELDNEKEKDVLTKRYIDCEGWNRICDETGYKWTQVHRNHSEALKNSKWYRMVHSVCGIVYSGKEMNRAAVERLLPFSLP